MNKLDRIEEFLVPWQFRAGPADAGVISDFFRTLRTAQAETKRALFHGAWDRVTRDRLRREAHRLELDELEQGWW